MKKTPVYIGMLFLIFVLAGCVTPTTGPAGGQANMTNPASDNCIKQGGVSTSQKRGDLGEYGVCVFPDDKQCGDWALMRGECPVGGLDITPYKTPAARYCVLTGGEYTATDFIDTENEQGECAFFGRNTCDAIAYFNGVCNVEP